MKIFAPIILVILSINAYSLEELPRKIAPTDQFKYVVRLNNGDLITGFIREMRSHPEEGDGFDISTDIGLATIYANQIVEIVPEQEYYKHSHRVYFLPTAEAIKGDHFAGMFEGLFFYAGAGITDYFSFTVGRSIIPFIPASDQLSNFNLKTTFLTVPFETMQGYMSFALGGNMAFVNHNNRLLHGYATATFTGAKSRLTGSLFYKAGDKNLYIVKFNNEQDDLRYTNGAFGIALGLDTKFSSWKGLNFIGELWNNDIAKPTNTAVLLGFRLYNSQFSADFGIAFFTEPFAAPFLSFVWTPF